MRIAYLLHCNFEKEYLTSGVYKKVLSQVKAWLNLGNEVEVFQITELNSGVPLLQPNWRIFKYKKNNFASRFKAWHNAEAAIEQLSPDVVYLRFDSFAFTFISKRIPIVVEVNTDDVKEYCLSYNLRCLFNLLTRRFIFRKVAGIVYVSKEISEKPYFNKFHKPYIVIGNGIDLSLYPPTSPPENREFNLVFIGSEGQVWHGIDKIIQLAQIKPDWQFHLIGTKKDFGLQNVKVYGALPREKYESIMAESDVAIGSLALHRKGINEGSPLKVREYLAYGLPVIIGYKDTDFPNKVPFILELPNCEDNVSKHVSEIEKFLNYWKGKRVPRSEVLQIDWSVKEKSRLQFLRKITEQWKEE